jgi:hypothetical protein
VQYFRRNILGDVAGHSANISPQFFTARMGLAFIKPGFNSAIVWRIRDVSEREK